MKSGSQLQHGDVACTGKKSRHRVMIPAVPSRYNVPQNFEVHYNFVNFVSIPVFNINRIYSRFSCCQNTDLLISALNTNTIKDHDSRKAPERSYALSFLKDKMYFFNLLKGFLPLVRKGSS